MATQRDETAVAPVKATPLPKMKMLAVSATFLTESICNSVLLPFVGLYVAHLQGISVEEAGYFSGILVGLFMLGQVVSSKLWGWVSDVYGRKVPLVLGLLAGSWAMFFFGLAPNIYVCCLMRFLHGIFNGNVLIAKIIVSDVTDATNAALGFSTIGLLWCVGCVIGPAIGGFLYDPLDNPKLQWMHVKQDSFLSRNPAFLPSLFVFIYTMGSFVLCVIVLPETNPHRTKSARDIPVIGVLIRGLSKKSEETAEEPVDSTPNRVEENVAPAPQKTASMTYARAMRDGVIRTITILYMCIAAGDMCFNEIMPLWAIASKQVGGLSMFADEVGTLMLLFAIPTFFSNLSFAKIYHALDNCRLMWRVCAVIYITSIVLIPCVSGLSDTTSFWCLLLLGSIKNCVGSAAFNIVHLQTARAAPPGTVGAVYGISQSFAYGVRTVVPFIVAPVFAWSISGRHSFPFNHYFVFFLSVIPLIYSIALTFVSSIERTDTGDTSDEVIVVEADADSVMQDYRSLANSFAMGGSQADNMFAQLTVPDEERTASHLWMRHTAPRGRGEELQMSVKALQQEDWRVVVDEEDGEGR